MQHLQVWSFVELFGCWGRWPRWLALRGDCWDDWDKLRRRPHCHGLWQSPCAPNLPRAPQRRDARGQRTLHALRRPPCLLLSRQAKHQQVSRRIGKITKDGVTISDPFSLDVKWDYKARLCLRRPGMPSLTMLAGMASICPNLCSARSTSRTLPSMPWALGDQPPIYEVRSSRGASLAPNVRSVAIVGKL